MLWKKRNNGDGMIYVDILKDKRFDMRMCWREMFLELEESGKMIKWTKNDEFSTKNRMQGNDLLLRMHRPEQAIRKYNKAICAAVSDTENLGMCFANRAACFMQLKRYSLCLNDIELAKKNGYPIRLWGKLDERKARCLKLLENCENKEPQFVEAKLSFPCDENFPCFASGIDVEDAENGEKKIVTNRNLEIGQTILIGKPYEMVSESPLNYVQCSNCFKTDANLLPCQKCTRVMFCSQECYDAGHERFHNIECEIGYRFVNWEAIRRLVFRTIIVAIQTFGTVQALMDAIDLFNKDKKIHESSPAKRNYFKFFGLPQDFDKIPFEAAFKFRAYILIIQSVIRNESILGPMFNTANEKLFLSHLILHHIHVVNKNSFYANSLAEYTYQAKLGVFNYSAGTIYARGITLDGKQMNHSCQPNVARIFVNDKIIYKVIRPLESGQELFVCYL